MAEKGNIFAEAAQAREQEQAKIEAAVTGRGPGRTKGVEKTKITLSITQEDADAVKMYAIKQHTTVSELLHQWIAEKCGE